MTARLSAGLALITSLMQKTLIGIGLLLVVLGFLWPWILKLGLGRLPGDIAIEKDNFRFYFPVTTSVVISIVITVVVWLLRK